MTTRGMNVLASFSLALVLANSAIAEEVALPNAAILEDFPVGKEGRFLILPVHIDGRTCQFVVDTGATITGFDQRQKPLLRTEVGAREIWTPGGWLRMKTYRCPEVRVGGQTLGPGNPVFCTDMSLLCQGLGEEVDGVLGMDFLRRYTIQIDFDGGRLRILESTPTKRAEWGEPVTMRVDRRKGVTILAKLGGVTEEAFLLDTGANTNSLATSRFQDLVDGRELDVLSTTHRTLTANGEVSGRSGRLESISVGSFSHRALRFDESPVSSFGLRYLARYIVTFDFPNHVLYLKPGSGHLRLNQPATSGLSVIKADGEFLVTNVNEQGPGAKAGVRPGDVIAGINGRKVDDLDLFALGKTLTSEVGKAVTLTILRESKELKVTLRLESRHPGKGAD